MRGILPGISAGLVQQTICWHGVVPVIPATDYGDVIWSNNASLKILAKITKFPIKLYLIPEYLQRRHRCWTGGDSVVWCNPGLGFSQGLKSARWPCLLVQRRSSRRWSSQMHLGMKKLYIPLYLWNFIKCFRLSLVVSCYLNSYPWSRFPLA